LIDFTGWRELDGLMGSTHHHPAAMPRVWYRVLASKMRMPPDHFSLKTPRI